MKVFLCPSKDTAVKTEFKDMFSAIMMLLIYEQMKRYKLFLEMTLQRNIMLQMELGGNLHLEDRPNIIELQKAWSLNAVRHCVEYLKLLSLPS